MRRLWGAVLLFCACGNDGTGGTDDWTSPREFEFGPYELQPGQEREDDCVQITLNNDDYVFVNQVELTTGVGFHHSNWFWVPEPTFAGPDGTFDCDERDYNEATAAVFGGVLFAQSTQAPHEIQKFPDGVVIKIPPRSKLFTQIHLLNPTDEPLTVTPKIAISPVAESEVTTLLAGISFQNQALLLPPMASSRFSVECDLGERHQHLFGRPPDFKIYYALAHYHDLATKLTIHAVKPTGERTVVYTTEGNVGDVLGGMLDPQFDMTGYTKLRMTCDFTNPRSQAVGWGVGDQEMCVFLAFSDSAYNFGGGVNDETAPQNPMLDGNTMTYENPCLVFATDASH